MARKCNKDKFISGKKEYLPFSEAKKVFRQIAQSNGLKNTRDYARFVRNHKDLIPSNIPTRPARVYSKSNIKKNRKNCIDTSSSVYY